MAEKADERNYLKPVAWLGGRDLLANLKYFLLFAAFKGKLDPRDWMKAEAFPPSGEELKPGEQEYFEAFNDSFREKPVAGEFWFDYFADSGDGMTAGYALAYLCMSDLEAKLPPDWNSLSEKERQQHLAAGEIRSRLARGDKPAAIARDYREIAPPDILAQLEQDKDPKGIIRLIEERTLGIVKVTAPNAAVSPGNNELPRGAFLFVGGDTCYHVADYAGLGLRFQKVFDWAYEDLKAASQLDDEQAEAKYWTELKRRPIFGVPGNHDYYDMVDGFNRQFGRSITRETKFINLKGRNMHPQLRLRAFKRFQTASYVAIKLPFGWWFWGVDSELKRVDVRQQEFFKRSYFKALGPDAREALKVEVKRRLTEEFGREPTAEEFDKHFPRLEQTKLGNRWPMPSKLIVATSEPTTVEGRRARDTDDVQDKTPQAFCFLDLTRPFMYREGKEARPDIRTEEQRLALSAFRCRLDISGDVHHYARYWGEKPGNDYASVVSGGGGASMSPTQTDYEEVQEHALYPDKPSSTRDVNKQLFKPWVVIRGGNVWMAGLIVAIIVYFGAGLSAHLDFSNSVLDYVARLIGRIPFLPTATAPHRVILAGLLESSGQLIELVLLLVVSVVALIGAGAYASWLFERLTKTHDWAVDRKENLRFGESKEEKSVEENLLFDKLSKLYGGLLNKIARQSGTDVSASMLRGFWWRALLGFLAAILLWVFELGSWNLSRGTRAVVFIALLLFTGFTIRLISSFSKKKYQSFKKMVTEFDKWPEHPTQENTLKKATREVGQVTEYTVTPSHDYVPFWSLLLLGASTFSLVGWEYWHDKDVTVTSFGNNALILFSIAVVVTAAVVGMYYSKWLFEQSYRIKVNLYSYTPVMMLTAIAIVVLVGAIGFFAKQPGRFIVADVLYLLALLAMPVGCIFLATKVGNHVPGRLRGLGFFALGLFHGVLQLVVPVLLVWLGDSRAFVIALLTVAVFAAASFLIVNYLKVEILIHPVTLPIVWFLYGLWMILIPFIWHRQPHELTIAPWPILILGSFVAASILGAALGNFSSRSGVLAAPVSALIGAIATGIAFKIDPLLATCILAGLIGAVMSCVWLGWYFAVALVFNGHANEAGSTARTEDYKHFIRFRLTKDSLTGYVIAVDFPQAPQNGDAEKSGANLKPRLVDVFTLECNANPATPWEEIEENPKAQANPGR